jgi:F-type H+-transporting ATPase subunit b
MIEAREALDRAAEDEAQKKTEEAENLRADYERRLTEFDERLHRREAELHEAMQCEREQMLSDARKDAENVRATARAEIADARTRALADLRAEIAALARELAEKALSDVPADPLVCLEAMLARREESELTRMRQDLACEGTLAVVTAADLSGEMRDRVRKALTDTLGEIPTLVFETDPNLLGGLRLRMPHVELDATVAGRLDKAAKAIRGDADDA